MSVDPEFERKIREGVAPEPAKINISLDGDIVQTVKGPRMRLDVCMMGVGEQTLETFVEAIAQRVMDKLDAQAAANALAEDPNEHSGPEQLIPAGASVWRPPNNGV